MQDSAYSQIEYNLSQNIDQHVLSSDQLAELIKDIIDSQEQNLTHGVDIFSHKYKALIEKLNSQ
jgi:hypothetical protein